MAANLKPVGDTRPPEAFPPTESAFLSGSGAAAPGAASGAAPFLGQSQREAAAVIRSALAKRDVFAALTAEPGLGKTLVFDAVIAQPGMPVRVFRLGNPSQVSAAQVMQIERALAQPAPGQRHTALFVDDAHAASRELLRFLAQLAVGGRDGPQVVLAGRPELWNRLAGPDLAPLLERIVLRPVLRPFTDTDARSLVRHILDQPRRSGQLLSAEAEAEVLRFGAGQPERIAQVLGGTLMLGDVQARPPLPTGMVRSAVAMLAGRQQPGQRRRAGAWVAGIVILAAAGGAAVAVRGWPPAVRDWPAVHDWPLAVRGWVPDRMLAVLGLQPGTVERVPVDAGSPPRDLPLVSQPASAFSIPVPALPGPPSEADAPANAARSASALPQSVEVAPSLVSPTLATPKLATPTLASPSLAVPPPVPAGLQPSKPSGTPAPLSPSTIALLLHQGDERLAFGDISAARRLYERAASAGSAAGARGVVRTYDPAVLRRAGMAADPAAAAAWQGVAATLGEAEARQEGR